MANNRWDATPNLGAREPPIVEGVFSPDGQVLATLSEDGRIRLWQVADGQLLHTLEGYRFIEFSPDGRVLATLSEDGMFRLWQVADGQLFHALDDCRFEFIKFSPDGQMLARDGCDGIEIWQWADRRLLRTFPKRYGSFSPDGQFLVLMSMNDLHLWRISDGKLLLKFNASGLEHLFAYAFSPDARNLVVLGSQGLGKVRLWQTSDGRLLRTWDYGRPGSGLVSKMEFSPDGRYLVFYLAGETSNRGKVELWRVSDGQQLFALDGNRVFFSPDSQLVAVEDLSVVSILRAADGSWIRDFGTIGVQGLLSDRLAILTDFGGVKTGVIENAQWGLCHIDLWSRAVR